MSGARFTFTSGGDRLVGLLYFPEGQPVAAVVTTGPLTSVKEQATGAYARALGARGFVALAFDHRSFGESDGEPRQFEHPEQKAADVNAAVTALVWGAKSLGKPRRGDFFSSASLELALRATFDADAAHDCDLLFELRLAERRLYVHVRDRAVSFPAEPSSPPDLVLATTPEVFAELFAGYTDIDAAVATARARVDGPKREGRRFFKLFHLPADPELAR
jgi:putative sterol carrier protein